MDKATYKLLKLIYKNPGIKLSTNSSDIPPICTSFFQRYTDFVDSLLYLHENDYIKIEVPFGQYDSDEVIVKRLDYHYFDVFCYPRYATLKGREYCEEHSFHFSKIFTYIFDLLKLLLSKKL